MPVGKVEVSGGGIRTHNIALADWNDDGSTASTDPITIHGTIVAIFVPAATPATTCTFQISAVGGTAGTYTGLWETDGSALLTITTTASTAQWHYIEPAKIAGAQNFKLVSNATSGTEFAGWIVMYRPLA